MDESEFLLEIGASGDNARDEADGRGDGEDPHDQFEQIELILCNSTDGINHKGDDDRP